MSISNTRRIIPSGLSVFGWHTARDEEGLVSIHVDVGFEIGKFGGNQGDQIEFELSFKRAEIVVICLDGAVPKQSTISRQKSTQKHVTEQTTKTTTAGANGSAELSLGLLNNNIAGKACGHVGTEIEHKASSKVEKAVSDFLIQHRQTSDGHFSWEVTASEGGPLNGNPWDANDEPRMKVLMPRGLINEPTVRVEVRCRGEDLHFGDGIRIKDEKKRGIFNNISNHDKNKAAAEQLLKSVLEEEGLKLSAPGERYGDITIADVVLTVD